MPELKVIYGGKHKFVDDTEIPGPDKPREEWTEEDRWAFESALWENSEEGDVQHAVKTLTAAPEEIETALRVLEEIRRNCEECAVREKRKHNDFDLDDAEGLLWTLRYRVRQDKAAAQQSGEGSEINAGV